jgi:hypothetical protein
MRVVAKLDYTKPTPQLSLSIFGAPHRRMHVAVIRQYREELRRACTEAGIKTPIDGVIDLWLLFVDPTSPDYDNLLCALYQAMDCKTLNGTGKTPGILTDDGKCVGAIRYLAKMYTTDRR